MTPGNNQIETLKYILENSLHPEVLDSHPWTKSLIALEASLQGQEPLSSVSGQQLVSAIEKLFEQIMPTSAPRRGKRLDTHWGEFGILAAQYFAPLRFGIASPTSLREAWGRIDQAILYFVYGKPEVELSENEIKTYKLVGDELVIGSNSTLSDWHRKGLLHLMEAVLARENYLSKARSVPVVIGQSDQDLPATESDMPKQADPQVVKNKTQRNSKRRFIFLILLLALLGLGLAGGIKVKKVYDLALLVRKDAVNIQALAGGSDSRTEKLKKFGPSLKVLMRDFKKLKDETEPFLWIGPWLKQVPVYGGDLASMQDLVTLADSLLTSVDQSYQAFSPLINEYASGSIDPVVLFDLLSRAQPKLIEAQHSLGLATEARSVLNVAVLSPRVHDLIVNDVDRVLPLLEDGLTFAVEVPRLMGSSNEGPKTYLLLAQNEDELRPTGGFITAASTVILNKGKISNLKFLNSGDFDNFSKLYPAAPWQLNQYMNSPVLIFRDANWFTNYPTAALYAEYLYSYNNDHSVDGVIAFDQQLLIQLLAVTGPIQVDDAPYPIGADNIVKYMREAKVPHPGDSLPSTWNNKAFLNKISYAIIEKVLKGEIKWDLASVVLLKALDEHHLLIQVDNPAMTTLLERYHWDGSVRPGNGDFLMAVDTNIGFNKTNAVVSSEIVYDVDLASPSNPTGALLISHQNNAASSTVCKQWLRDHFPGESDYPITDCYWNYLRIYKPEGTALIKATPQLVPDIWMINKQSDPGQVDVLNEEIDHVQAFGTLQVVPSGESLSIDFQFSLPASILKSEAGHMTYTLKVQKQPGTLAVPFTLRIHLAANTTVDETSPGAVIDGHNILYQTDLRMDREFLVQFTAP